MYSITLGSRYGGMLIIDIVSHIAGMISKTPHFKLSVGIFLEKILDKNTFIIYDSKMTLAS